MKFLKTNIIEPNLTEYISKSYTTILSFLIDQIPEGFVLPTDIFINEERINLDEYDTRILQETDVILLVERPNGIGALLFTNAFLIWATDLVVSLVLGYALNKIFAPDIPDYKKQDSPSTVYSLSLSSNKPAKGQVIPVIYGTVRQYPSMIEEAYSVYENNNEYLFQLLCIGQGKFNFKDLFIGESNIDQFPNDVQTIKLEQGNFSNIADFTGDDLYYQTTRTLVNPSNLELVNIEETEYQMGFGNNIITVLDYRDTYNVGDTITVSDSQDNDGDYIVEQISSTGNEQHIFVENTTFTPEPYNSFADTSTSHEGNKWIMDNSYGYLYSLPIGTQFQDENYTHYIITARYQGFEEWIVETDVNALAALGTTLTRTTALSKISYFLESEKYTINNPTGLDFVEIDYIFPNGLYESSNTGVLSSTEVQFTIRLYDGPGTLLYTQVETTSSGSLTAQRRSIRVPMHVSAESISLTRDTPTSSNSQIQNKMIITKIKELYTPIDNSSYNDITLLWVKMKATNAISSAGQTALNGYFERTDVTNGLDEVITDIYTNTTYGARLPIADLVYPGTVQEKVNGAFSKVQTIWDSMNLVAKSQRYNLYPVGQNLNLKYDNTKSVSVGLYNEINIIKDSFTINYLFKEENEPTDSIEVSYYSEEEDWKELTSTYPENGLYPLKMPLFGVTDITQAELMAKYIYKSDRSRTKIVTFQSDIQALVPEFLDKILVSHSTLLNGSASEVSSIDGKIITLLYSIETGTSVTFRDSNTGTASDTVSCIFIDEFSIEVSNIPLFVEEGTSLTVGNPTEFLVTKIKPKDAKSFTIEAVLYDDDIYV